MGGRCSYGCSYCYTHEHRFECSEKKTPEEIIALLEQLPEEVKLIQCGYDNEFFKNEFDAVKIIKAIADLDKNVSFSTKKDLSFETIEALKEIQQNMSTNQYMVACVSLLGFKTIRRIEPNAPDPEKRVETIHRLFGAKIPTLVYLRPLIPTIPEIEIEEVFAKTAGHCDGYVVGKMIFDKRNPSKLSKGKKRKMNWSKDKREWYEYVDSRAKKLAKRPNVFLHRSEAFSFIKAKQTLKQALLKHAKQKTSKDDASHDFSHALRVLNNAEFIASHEGGDLNIVIPAALFHDIVMYPKNDPRSNNSARESANEAEKILLSIQGYDSSKIALVKKAIIEHSFSSGLKPTSQESKILQDADRLECTGAIAIMRTFSSSGQMSRRFYNLSDPFCEERLPNSRDSALDFFYKRLLKMQDSMNTKTARKLAEKRTSFLHDFLGQLKDEITEPSSACVMVQ